MPTPANHPTQIFMHNAKALRVEYLLDQQRLLLWWSPRAGQSYDSLDRNFSNRDNHLDVFESITLPGCGLGEFQRCDYDPYHCVLYFEKQVLHLVVLADAPAVALWADAPQAVEFKTGRYDQVLVKNEREWLVEHDEPAYTFEFATVLGRGQGSIETCPVHGPWSSHWSLASIAPEQVLAIGVGLSDEDIAGSLRRVVAQEPTALLADIDAQLAPIEAMGRIHAAQHPELEQLRRCVVRGLHSMIDDSGAFRASIKAIYYLIWVRDAGFAFAYQAAAGWPHRLRELCRLLLDNPTTVQSDGVPPGQMFAQLINKDYGKYEEDGAFYVLWTLFTHWTQSGSREFFGEQDLALLSGAVEWLETYIWDEERGLFGGHFADESPSYGARDHGTDYAIGKPLSYKGHVRHDEQPVVKFYDTYLNLLMHSSYTMLAAIIGGKQGTAYTAKAATLWQQLAPFFDVRTDGLPTYGELLLGDGSRVYCPHWGKARSVYVWALSMPCFAPVDDWDQIRIRLLEAMMDKPGMHWINGICSAAAAVDPWCYDEDKLLAIIKQVQVETDQPGPYLPMGGAMPEKFDAPQGNLYHDIRPQGFSMGAWLGAWSALGVRRLPYGLALRPTTVFERIEQYLWRDSVLDITFNAVSDSACVQVNGETMPGTLQVPQGLLRPGDNAIAICSCDEGPVLIRSSVQLDLVVGGDYDCSCFGLSELVFAGVVESVTVTDQQGPIELQRSQMDGLSFIRFTAAGSVRVSLG